MLAEDLLDLPGRGVVNLAEEGGYSEVFLSLAIRVGSPSELSVKSVALIAACHHRVHVH